jgi:hypothetical protein
MITSGPEDITLVVVSHGSLICSIGVLANRDWVDLIHQSSRNLSSNKETAGSALENWQERRLYNTPSSFSAALLRMRLPFGAASLTLPKLVPSEYSLLPSPCECCCLLASFPLCSVKSRKRSTSTRLKSCKLLGPPRGLRTLLVGLI